MRSVGFGVGRLQLDAADTDTSLNADSDKAFLSPGGTPGVLDQVVFLAGIRSVANSEDTMVKLKTAVFGDDARSVLMECGLACSDGNRKGSLGKSGLELRHISRHDLVLTMNFNSSLGLVLSHALSSHSCSRGVRVDRLLLSKVLSVVVESQEHVTTVASMVERLVTRDELLLGEGHEVATCDLMSSLERSSGGERPARSTLALVLDGGDGSFSHPVDGVFVRGSQNSGLFLGHTAASVTHEHLLLSVSPSRHEVVSELMSDSLGLVVAVDDGVDGLKLFESEVELLNGSVAQTEVRDVLHERRVD